MLFISTFFSVTFLNKFGIICKQIGYRNFVVGKLSHYTAILWVTFKSYVYSTNVLLGIFVYAAVTIFGLWKDCK